ncbi:protein of unknown function (DUF1744) [Popillia japonica]|uniref:DNA polymerase epsilon catalytic subunit n=1 Tax=Popillia japonica TaxID=7064 RepID=A0AAW1HSF4_POPJA
MTWMWRGEYMPATRNEYQMIQQQLEIERFPPQFPGGQPRAFHQLTRVEQADLEKKRLQIYCRKAYKKVKLTRTEERATTICQKENSFYVDTVRAFRDRRYEYKGLSKKAKQEVSKAVKGGNAAEIKSAKNKEVLYDSLQLAHKCILNSFYGYVMRRGARWHSMEMAGIVCYTGANIIMKAREIIEQVGRPLELDTDGIWCILPASFPENFTIHTSNEKKSKINISYPNAVLNAMVKEHFTNDQYHELVNPELREYELKSENSIFFEVDGPYKAMVLPASKEEGKKLKKRYAVFNFDGSLAELKGFEVKRRGELQLIKNFQSSVFEAFLKGDSLESCYAAVAQVADYWLDVLYSHGRNMPDSELFDLISENRSMSKKLDEYGGQKSTSISTAKRLAEFLGDQMVKDAGLACKYVISRKPDGAPVTERAIPLAIFQTEESVQKHFLRRWLKDTSINEVDIRDILDWGYYIERLGGAIQKIITIPAAMQGVANPVPRIRHPDWLHKRMLEKNDNFKQRRIDDMFANCPKPTANQNNGNSSSSDIEDIANTTPTLFKKPIATVSKRKRLPNSNNEFEDVDFSKSWKEMFKKPIATVSKRKRLPNSNNEFEDVDFSKSWKEVLGSPPPVGTTKEERLVWGERLVWVIYQKKKWRYQIQQRNHGGQVNKRKKTNVTAVRTSNSLSGFIQKAQRTLITSSWQIIQISMTPTPGEYRLWALVQSELHLVRFINPRIFYANLRTQKCADEGALFRKCNRILPRSRPCFNLYMYTVPEDIFQEFGKKMYVDLTDSNVEGIYETQVPPLFRALLQLGCVCRVIPGKSSTDTFSLDELDMISVARQPYLPKGSLKHLYLYQHRANTGQRQIFGLFLTPARKALIVVVDSVRTNLMPNMNTLYQAERIVRIDRDADEELLPPEAIQFEIRVETNLEQVYKVIQKALQTYKDEKPGPTLLAIQSFDDVHSLVTHMPGFNDFPTVQVHVKDMEDLYNNLEWQKVGARAMIRHYLNSEKVLELMTEQCRYFHLPLGNMPSDPAIFGADLFYARHLMKQNHVLWCSPTDRPDLGGSQECDSRLLAENQESASEICNNPGWYSSMCVELDIDSLAICTLLQSPHITTVEGTSNATSFDAASHTSLDEMVSGNPMTIYDETARCAEAFRILRTMASTWMRDISVHRNVFADFQVVHFYRWLRSTKSLLYDPAILRTLQNLMKKLFMQLVAEFKRLGCTIIYANFNKIIVSTKKKTVSDAVANIEFVVNAIRNKELFHSLEISYRQCWEQLIWLDPANYAGIQGKLPNEEDPASNPTENEEKENEDEEDDDDEQPIVVMNWNLADQLPEAAGCRNSFNTVIAGYINAIHMKLKEVGNQQTVIALSQPTYGLVAHEEVIRFAKDIISGEISQNLFEITERIKYRLTGQTQNGSYPALDFVKAICHVLSLDPAVEECVQTLKSNLLRLVGVGEFSDKAVWKDSTVSYVIPQLICKACNHCRDVDLGRDPYRSETAWLCPICNTGYDNMEIESLLLDIVTKKMLAYNLQDLQCKKCAQIKLENLIKHCQCAGEFRGIISRDDLIALFKTFLHLAETYSMHALQETITNILELAL